MRRGVIYRVATRMLWLACASLVVPLLIALAYRDGTWDAWLIALMLAGVSALTISEHPTTKSSPRDSLRRREGFLAVVLGWMLLVFFTALAYHIGGAFAGFAECFFESMSGYTTTGATVAPDIEALPKSVLMMRSLSHWIGGMGLIVLSVAILPELSVGGMQLFAAEASGIGGNDKLAPRIAQTARRLWVLYVAITLLETMLLLFGGMGLFDAINHSMATIATGGFSTKNASIGHFDSFYIELVIIVFMFVSGISFALQFRAIALGKFEKLWASAEVRLYTAITIGAIALVTLDTWAYGTYDDAGDALRQTSFQVVSIITTTGFGTTDFDAWPDFTRVLLVALMLLGGCAGSTAGGSKVIRLLIIAKHARMQLRRLIRPRIVEPLHIDGREVPREATEGILGYYLLFFTATVVLGLAMTALGLDLISGTTAAVSVMNSIGPGLGSVGAVQNFADVPDTGLYLLSGGMLLGRLEIYPVLVLFTTHFWRRG